jgi:hypothetical protein
MQPSRGDSTLRGNFPAMSRLASATVLTGYKFSICVRVTTFNVGLNFGRTNRGLPSKSLICAMQIPVVEAYLGLTSSLPCYSQIQMVAAGEASGVEVQCRTIRTFVLALMQEPIVVHP